MEPEQCIACQSFNTVRHYRREKPDEIICRDCGHKQDAKQQSMPGIDWSKV